jgi:response regulator RpfG family c-di-GMP phosphodiesterase
VATENVRSIEELDAVRVETMQRLALAAEYRDRTTYEHTERVATTAFLIALPARALPSRCRADPPSRSASRHRA